jgi:hypothetical protein
MLLRNLLTGGLRDGRGNRNQAQDGQYQTLHGGPPVAACEAIVASVSQHC